MSSVDVQVELAAKLFIYGYPVVYNLEEIASFVAGGGAFPVSAPFNRFGHARELAGPETRFVSPNNDTCYSIAACDVRDEPLVLHVPDTGDRYYVLQFVDAWTNNFAYVGQRATGTGEGEFLLAPAGWAGDAPAGMPVIHVPTGVFVIVGRIQVDGVDDLPAVHALQDALTLTPLSGTVSSPRGVPEPDPRVGDELSWWERLRVALATFPPPATDAPLLEAGETLGLMAEGSPFVEPAPGLAEVLIAGERIARAKLEELMQQVHATPEGWQSAVHLFDYNVEHFEIGALDAPEWRIDDRETAAVTRAIAARAGLWGNHGYEAAYAVIWVDADGEPLDGSSRYELRLPSPPPVDAFWSLTMYAPPDFYLVDNPIGRYSVGDRTPGLRVADDGSVTIVLQPDRPGPDEDANWLPAPAGPFRPIMRMYRPRQEVVDGTYVLPAIVKRA